MGEDIAWSAFKKFDVSNVGAIRPVDLHKVFGIACGSAKKSCPNRQIKELIAACDRHGDGKVSFEEFMQMLEDSQGSCADSFPKAEAKTRRALKRPANSTSVKAVQSAAAIKRPSMQCGAPKAVVSAAV